MPEYSNTTIAPADGVQVPSMNGSTSGNFALSALRSYILASKGQANGLAGLGPDGKLDANQIPDSLDDVLVYATRSNFPVTGADGKIYITADNNKLYRWDSNASDYVELSVDLSAYATKAEVNALSARVSNLEQTTKQDEQTVQYPDDGNYSSIMPNGVPARVAKYGEVAGIRGKSRAWNQLVNKNVLLASSSASSVSCTNNGDGSFTVSGTASADAYLYMYVGTMNLNPSHYYFILPSGSSSTIEYKNSSDATGYSACNKILTDIKSITQIFNYVTSGLSVNFRVYVQIYDLTLIFGAGNEPSTVADALAQLPALGQYNAYDAGSLVDTEVSGVKSVGVNIYDQEWEVGRINDTTGATEAGNSDRIRSKNFIPVLPSTAYYWYVGFGGNGMLYYYDINKNYIDHSGWGVNTDRTTPANCYYIKFVLNDVYGTVYRNDVQICLNSYADKTTYHPYQRNSLMLSTPVTLRSAGSVAEVLTLETGKKTRPVGSYTFTGSETWIYYADKHLFYSDCIISSVKVPADAYTTQNLTFSIYNPMGIAYLYYNTADKTIAIGTSDYFGAGLVVVYDSGYDDTTMAQFKANMAGKTINYELATPLADEQVCDPIINNYIEVEGGGTINTIQSQTPVIDNCLDVTYDFIPA